MRYIDQEQIYSQTEQGLTIFQHYFPGEDLTNSRRFFKLRESEKTASARLSFFGGFWRVTDFGNKDEINGLKAIDFVVWREKLPYYDALLYIEQVILNKKIEGSKFVRTKFEAGYEQREMRPDDKKGEYRFTFKENATENDLAAIGRYITQDILDRFHCKVVDQYEYCGPSKKSSGDVVHTFKATEHYPMFLFDYGGFKKLYKPHEQNKQYRFVYIGQKPAKYVYGLTQLEKAKNEFVDTETGDDLVKPEEKENARVIDLFRCSGESDALNLASLGFHVYWLNSESEDLDFDTWKMLDDLCQNHYQVMDLDRTGQDQAMKNALKHIDLFTIELPPWLKNKNDWRGNPCKDLKDFINLAGSSYDKTKFEFLVLKRSARRVKFWDKITDPKTKKINYNINMEFFFWFLRANGFYQMDSVYHKKAGYCYVKLDGRVAYLIHPDDIKRMVKRFTKEWISNRKLLDKLAILNKINTSAQLTESNIESIDSIELNFKNHDRFTEYIHFKNRSIKITKDKIETVRHDELPNWILGSLNVSNREISHLVERDIRLIKAPPVEVDATPEYQDLLNRLEKCNDEERENLNAELAQFPETDKYTLKFNDNEFIFTQFLRDLARLHWKKEQYEHQELSEEDHKEEALAMINMMFVIGYHCAQYKDPGKPWLTFLQDNAISDIGQASGRSGKSLLSQAMTYVRASFYKGGRTLNDRSAYQFFYDGLTEFHDYIEVDDLHEYADFGFFYTQVTGKREVNPKNYTPITLDYEDSGKMLISSNFELQHVDSSTVGRLLNCSVSDYYHEKTKFNNYMESRSPLTKFGRRIYDDFTDEEWIKFYNFIAYCVQLQMRFHKINPPAGNIEKRQLRRLMAQGLGRDEEFFRWANDYFVIRPKDFSEDYSPAENGYFNTYVIRDNAFENFTSVLTAKQRHEYKSGKFKKHLEAWCEYYGFELNPESVCSDLNNRRILKTIESKTRELIYISTHNTDKSIPPPQPPDDEMPF